MNKDAYDSMSNLRGLMIDEIKKKFDNVISDTNQTNISFKLFDDEYLLRARIDAFKKTGSIRLYNLIDDSEIYGQKKLNLIPEMEVTLQIASLNGGDEPVAIIVADVRKLFHTPIYASRFAEQYKEFLIDHLKKINLL